MVAEIAKDGTGEELRDCEHREQPTRHLGCGRQVHVAERRHQFRENGHDDAKADRVDGGGAKDDWDRAMAEAR